MRVSAVCWPDIMVCLSGAFALLAEHAAPAAPADDIGWHGEEELPPDEGQHFTSMSRTSGTNPAEKARKAAAAQLPFIKLHVLLQQEESKAWQKTPLSKTAVFSMLPQERLRLLSGWP